MRPILIFLSLVFLFSSCKPKNNLNSDSKESKLVMLVGSYTKKEGHVDGQAQGINQIQIAADGTPGISQVIIENIVNPSFIQLSSDGNFLYAVSETGPDVDTVAYVYAYRKNDNGNWDYINRQSTHSFAPCHISIHPNNKMLSVANYVGGIVCLYPIKENGALEAAASVLRFEGKTEHPRQESSHPHASIFDPKAQQLYIPDLGSNKIWTLKINPEDPSQYSLAEAIELQAAAGPRHFVFHPNGKYAYVANELDNTVVAFKLEEDQINLSKIQTLSTLPDNYQEESYVADIHIRKGGKDLYISNRGHNSLAHFKVDPTTGLLEKGQYYSTEGDFPRNFAIHPNDNYLYVANQNSDNIVWYNIEKDGKLEQKGSIQSPTPVCLKFSKTN